MNENEKNQNLEAEATEEMPRDNPADTSAETVEDAAATAEPPEEGKLKGNDKKRLKRAETELAEVKKKLDAAEAALAEEKDKYLRMLAEYDNFRRRTAKEKESIYGDAAADTVKGLLPVIDTLERAAAALTPEDVESPLGKGITMTLKSATDALTKLGVEEVPCDIFNPDLHNAVMHVEDENLAEGVIVSVFQKGYRKGDRVIRYAMVQVAN